MIYFILAPIVEEDSITNRLLEIAKERKAVGVALIPVFVVSYICDAKDFLKKNFRYK